jgi:uncharacterized protein (TIGR03067 family)
MTRLLLPVAAICFFAASAFPEDTKEDLKRLQGTWKVVGLTNDGKKAPPDKLEGAELIVIGNAYVLKGEDTFRGKLKLDATQKPKFIDATFIDEQGQEKGKAAGIYQQDGDELRICWREKGDQRPNEFASKPGSNIRLIVLKRAKK